MRPLETRYRLAFVVHLKGSFKGQLLSVCKTLTKASTLPVLTAEIVSQSNTSKEGE